MPAPAAPRFLAGQFGVPQPRMGRGDTTLPYAPSPPRLVGGDPTLPYVPSPPRVLGGDPTLPYMPSPPRMGRGASTLPYLPSPPRMVGGDPTLPYLPSPPRVEMAPTLPFQGRAATVPGRIPVYHGQSPAGRMRPATPGSGRDVFGRARTYVDESPAREVFPPTPDDGYDIPTPSSRYPYFIQHLLKPQPTMRYSYEPEAAVAAAPAVPSPWAGDRDAADRTLPYPPGPPQPSPGAAPGPRGYRPPFAVPRVLQFGLGQAVSKKRGDEDRSPSPAPKRRNPTSTGGTPRPRRRRATGRIPTRRHVIMSRRRR